MAEFHYQAGKVDASVSGRVAVISTRWNPSFVSGLVSECRAFLEQYVHVETDYFVVPGAFELPWKASVLAGKGIYDVIVVFGCVVRGETKHFDLVTTECARGCMEVQLRYGIPVVFEVLAVNDFLQAEQRSDDGEQNVGRMAAITVLDLLSASS